MARRDWAGFCFGLLILAGFCAHGSSPERVGQHRYVVQYPKAFAVQGTGKFDVRKYLPPGAEIRDSKRDVVFADVEGDGTEEAVVFYFKVSEAKPGILILKPRGNDYVVAWERTFDVGWGFSPPSGVYDLNKTGLPQIVAYRLVGASCDSQLDIYQYRDGKFDRIVDWAPGTCQASLEFRDLDGDGPREIIFETANYGTNPDIYRWDGRRYVLSNARFPAYYNKKVEELLRSVHSTEALPASARLMWTRQIVEIYSLQRRYSEIIGICEIVLRIIDDPRLTVPSTIVKGDQTLQAGGLMEASFRREKNRVNATLHRYEARAYAANGKHREAQQQDDDARSLESDN